MPITPPPIDERRFAQLVEDTLARARVHTPEWTHFGQSDPGVTLVQLFAFLTESLLFRANQIPERNRAKFLQLLRLPLQPASAASGLVAIANERAAPLTQFLPANLEVQAGAVPFRTGLALDVLPVEARVLFKRKVATPAEELLAHYRLLYASYGARMPPAQDLDLYETVALEPQGVDGVDLNTDTVDGALWIALLARPGDAPGDAPGDPWKAVRDQLGGRTLMLGIVPALDAQQARLRPGGNAQPAPLLRFQTPRPTAELDWTLPRDATGQPAPAYTTLVAHADVDLLSEPGVVQLPLPGAEALGCWRDADPLEAGVGEMPPPLDDPAAAGRLITWLCVRASGAARARLRWVGINTTPVRQVERIAAEPLADGDGTPDQVRRLARAPVLPGSVRVTTRGGSGAAALVWTEIDDLGAAGPEVAVADPRAPMPAAGLGGDGPTEVFELDAEAGELRFGDGLRGRRLPPETRVHAAYEYCLGARGNVPAGAIDRAAQLPAGFAVRNPVQTWGGADAETVAAGEKQVRRHLQHRDRLVSVDDFEAIACRTPGVQLGRIEVLPAFHPDLGAAEPGSAPGVVTVLAIPRHDPEQPDAPRADRLFLGALCRHLDPRRLATTELVVRGPRYKGVWISVGIETAVGVAVAQVVDEVRQRLLARLRPVGSHGGVPRETPLFTPRGTDLARGWPLRTAVSSRVLLAEAARVEGVTAVVDLLLAEAELPPSDAVAMSGLELPRVLGLSVVEGEPLSIDELRGSGTGRTGTAGGPGLPATPGSTDVPGSTGGPGSSGSDAATSPPGAQPAAVRRRLPVPIVPESC